MDRVSDMMIAVCTAVGAMGAFIVKKIWGRMDKLEKRIQFVERKLLTKDDLDQIKDTQNLILQSLLEHRNTENTDVHK